MRYLILSDLHANWQALEAVLAQTAGTYDEVLCCGDLVGYGADPNPVVEWVRANCKQVVRGNHDKVCTGAEDLEWFNPVAREAALWTQAALTPENASYIRALPQGPLVLDGFELVHGSPFDEDEYVIGAAEAAVAFDYLECRVAFFGHTHLQGGFIWNHGRMELIAPPWHDEPSAALTIDPECAYMINPGSVGQPRDGDPRAAYAVYQPEARLVTLFRTEYDVAAAQKKILKAGLPELLAARLQAGV